MPFLKRKDLVVMVVKWVVLLSLFCYNVISCVHDFNFMVDETFNFDVDVWKMCC